jgi:hypothetical protein
MFTVANRIFIELLWRAGAYGRFADTFREVGRG